MSSVHIKKVKSPLELRMSYFGLPAALIVLALILTMPTPIGLTYSAKMAMGIFAFALILWISGSIPTYLTSMIVLVLLPLSGAWTEKQVLGVFGYEVIWLMVAAFIITSGMEKSGLAKRLSLYLITKFGKTTNSILVVLMVVNFLIALVVPSTTARAAILLPIVILVAEAFGVTGEEGNQNFGKLLGLQSLHGNAFSTSAIVTATSSQILAIGFIKDLTGTDISWGRWFIAGAPIAIASLVASYFIGRVLFKTKNKEADMSKMDKLKEDYKALGKMSSIEKKALAIFVLTIFLWSTDELHISMFGFQLSLYMVAILSAALFFMPNIGILNWKEAKIPWDLMIFSCGAYAGGIALNETGMASWALDSIFANLGLENMSFMALYAIVIFIASFSHLVFTSKTVRTIILIPTIISIGQVAGVDPVALALPAAFAIADTITLPPHCKPSLIFYSTGHYNVLDQLTYGATTLFAKWGILVVASFTWFKFLGIV